MKLTELLLGCGVVGLGIMVSQQASTIKDQQTQLQTAQSQIKTASLSLQEKCSSQARKMVAEYNFADSAMASYENHYNLKLNKCVVNLQHHATLGKTGMVFKSIVDAFERKYLASYEWQSEEGKKYWEVAPYKCTVVAITGEDQPCKSEEEFKKLIQVYMQG